MKNINKYKDLSLILLVSVTLIWAATEPWSALSYFRAFFMGSCLSIIISVILLSSNQILEQKWKEILDNFSYWQIYPISIIASLLAVYLYQSMDSLFFGYMLPVMIWMVAIAVNTQVEKMKSPTIFTSTIISLVGGLFTGLVCFIFPNIFILHFLQHLAIVLFLAIVMLALFILSENFKVDIKQNP